MTHVSPSELGMRLAVEMGSVRTVFASARVVGMAGVVRVLLWGQGVGLIWGTGRRADVVLGCVVGVEGTSCFAGLCRHWDAVGPWFMGPL